MTDTRSVLIERLTEIRRTKSLITNLQSSDPEVVSRVFGSQQSQQLTIRPLFSTFALMHYSIVEAVITVGITEMVEHVSDQNMENASDDYLKFLIQCRLKDIKNLNFSNWYEPVKILLDEYSEGKRSVSLTQDQVRSLWAGNLDARKIRENLLEKLNLEINGTKKARDGSDLRKIKDDRNDLSHGIKSWNTVGGNYSWAELASISNRILIYIIRFVKCTESATDNAFWEGSSKEMNL
ncbi:MAG: MAE_28990/MAE_18760 family HEPN-like nuclease [Opitutales bacterium]|nr:MAE_28990/MAE_18760 family HEPN-like nuclease [Opitutales bacterium]